MKMKVRSLLCRILCLSSGLIGGGAGAVFLLTFIWGAELFFSEARGGGSARSKWVMVEYGDALVRFADLTFVGDDAQITSQRGFNVFKARGWLSLDDVGGSSSPQSRSVTDRVYRFRRWGLIKNSETVSAYTDGDAACEISQTAICIPLWPLIALTVWPVRAYYHWMTKRKRVRRGECENCGYDLRGSVSGLCPECGSCRCPS